MMLLSVSVSAQEGGSDAANDQIKEEVTKDQKKEEVANEEADVEELIIEEVIVTGTQIKGVKVSGMLAVSSFGQEQIEAIQGTTTDDLYGYMPEAMAEIEFGDLANAFNSHLNGSRGDLAALNLRSLGPNNTLQLLNGRRLVRHSSSQAYGGVPITVVNTNAIPARGVKRIDILRDGGAALYGADAVAGVANTILRDNYEGLWGEIIYGNSEGTTLERTTVNLLGGKDFNNGRTNVSLSMHFTNQEGYFATDHPRSASSDLRPFYIGTDFEGDTQLDNRASYTDWGQFNVVNPANNYHTIRVRDMDGVTITSGTGRFHIQPEDYQPGACRGGSENDTNPGVCIDDGTRHRDHYYDRNRQRMINNDVKRFNSFLFVNHEFESGMELFAEVSYYKADSHRQAEMTFMVGTGPLSVSPEAYWNPFGERLSGNPNRLAEANVPDAGYALDFTAWRPTDVGPQTADITNHSYRTLVGLRGEFKGWDWETALVYSKADTTDWGHNWVSSTLLMEAINRTDELAYNPFNGGCVDTPTFQDTCTPGTTEEVMDEFRIDIYRKNYTDLTMADFRISKPDLFSMWGREVGMAAGIEWRDEGFKEDRDPRLDGTITYTNTANPTKNQDGIGDTDVFGLSFTPDAKGSASVGSVFVEFYIPITDRFNIQYAGRFEEHQRTGGIYVNKLAGSWDVFESLRLRGSYAEGFKEPSLPLLFTPPIIRNGSGTDNYRCYAYGELGTDEEVQALWDSGLLTSDETYELALAQNDVTCNDGQGNFPSPQLGGPNLEPETSEQVSVGFVFMPLANLMFTADYWEIKQFDVFNRIYNNESLSVDFARRLDTENPGTYLGVDRLNPDAIDAELYALAGLPVAGRVKQIYNFYTNLDERVTRGFDVLGQVDFDTGIGDFLIKVQAFKMLERTTTTKAVLQNVNDLGFPDLQYPGDTSTVGIDGFPEWRATGTVFWNRNLWRVSTTTRCVSGFTDTSVSNGEKFLDVPGGCSTNANVRKSFRSGWLDGAAIVLGARNILAKEPAYNDSVYGTSNLFANLAGRYWYINLSMKFL